MIFVRSCPAQVADENVLVVAVVEDTRAISKIDEIAATPGIDVLFIGTSDLSFSLGLRGAQDDPRLEEAVAKVVAAGKKHGKFLGRPAWTPEQVKKFQAQGFQFFMSATDIDFMAAGAALIASCSVSGREHARWQEAAARESERYGIDRNYVEAGLSGREINAAEGRVRRRWLDWTLISIATAMFVVLASVAHIPELDFNRTAAIVLCAALLLALFIGGTALWKTTRFS